MGPVPDRITPGRPGSFCWDAEKNKEWPLLYNTTAEDFLKIPFSLNTGLCQIIYLNGNWKTRYTAKEGLSIRKDPDLPLPDEGGSPRPWIITTTFNYIDLIPLVGWYSLFTLYEEGMSLSGYELIAKLKDSGECPLRRADNSAQCLLLFDNPIQLIQQTFTMLNKVDPKKLILPVTFWGLCFMCTAQARISGIVLDSANHQLTGANLSLGQAPDYRQAESEWFPAGCKEL